MRLYSFPTNLQDYIFKSALFTLRIPDLSGRGNLVLSSRSTLYAVRYETLHANFALCSYAPVPSAVLVSKKVKFSLVGFKMKAGRPSRTRQRLLLKLACDKSLAAERQAEQTTTQFFLRAFAP